MKKIQITARTRAPEPITQSVLDKAVERGKMRQNTDKALRLADRLEGRWALHPEMQEVAAELRRQHGANERLYKLAEDQDSVIRRQRTERQTLEAQRDALLEALKSTRAFINSVAPYGGLLERVNAAIKAVEE